MLSPPSDDSAVGSAEVDGRKRGEDERLQGCDQQDLEEEEDDRHGQGEHAQRGDAEQHHQAAAHEQDQQWPARMFANNRTDSEMIRTKCEITSITKIGTAAAPSTPAGTQLFR